MRFDVTIKLKGMGDIVIPSNYRKNFMALIKEALKNTALGEKYFSSKAAIPKPFTFSVSFKTIPDKNEKGKLVLANENIIFHFSTLDYAFLTAIYNGLIGMKGKYRLFQKYENSLYRFNLHKINPIQEKMIVFKTHSPILVRKFQGRKAVGFIGYPHTEFIPNLKLSISSMCMRISNISIGPEDIEITPIKMESTIIKHYGGELGATGILSIAAPVNVLGLIYDIGVGAKRSQGFGMLEVLG